MRINYIPRKKRLNFFARAATTKYIPQSETFVSPFGKLEVQNSIVS